MKITPSRASIAIWTAVASLLIIAAVIAAYAVFFSQRPSARDSACKTSSQHAENKGVAMGDMSIADVVCGSGIAQ